MMSEILKLTVIAHPIFFANPSVANTSEVGIMESAIAERPALRCIAGLGRAPV